MTKPHIIVIGAGFTGCATAYDLALRGFQVSVIERGEIASGTSGRTHGHLHSGARYCVVDQEAAKECILENRILRKIAFQCIEPNGGLALVLREQDLQYAEKFSEGVEICGIPAKKLSAKEALNLEPNINPDLLLAYSIPDGTFDPLRFALAFAASAKKYGARFFCYHQLMEILVDDSHCVTGVRVWDRNNDRKYDLKGDLIVNATGPWAGQVAAMAGIQVQVTPTPGIMVAYDQRLVQHLVQRLGVPFRWNSLLPQRRMVVIGTTSFEVENIDYIPVFKDQLRQMQAAAEILVPSIRQARLRGAYMAARPLIGSAEKGRSISRTFVCYNHKVLDGIEGFITITGGKATTCRIMAEKTCDTICQNLGIDAECQTMNIPLVSYREYYREN